MGEYLDALRRQWAFWMSVMCTGLAIRWSFGSDDAIWVGGILLGYGWARAYDASGRTTDG